MPSEIETWMRGIEQRLVEFDRRIRSKEGGGGGGGGAPSGPAGGDLTGSYPDPLIAAGAVVGGPGGAIADGTVTHIDIAAANKDGAAGTPSMRTLGTGATQAVAGNDPRLSDARPPTAHTHSASQITSGVLDLARIPTGTTVSTVALGSHTHTLSSIVAGGTMDAPLVMVDRLATPGSIPSGSTALYFKTDGKAYTVDDSGVERPLIPVPDQLHANASFDNVAASTAGGFCTSTVPSRLMPTAWDWTWCNGALSTVSDETVTLDGLGRSLKVTLPAAGGNLALLSNTFAVLPGSVVTVSAWVRGEAGTQGTVGIMTHDSTPGDPTFFDPDHSMLAGTPNIVFSATWQKISASFAIPAGHTKCRVNLSANNGGSGAIGSVWWDETESSMLTVPLAQVIPGTIIMWPTAVAPAGYLACNGGTFSSETYPALAAVLGDTYGTHTGTTYFLPKFKSPLPDTDWIDLPLTNNWLQYDTANYRAQYKRENGIVYVRGLVKKTVGAVNENICQLPVGFRPAQYHIFSTMNASATYPTAVYVNFLGWIQPAANASGAWTSLSGIQYPADDVNSSSIYIIKT